MHFNFSAKNLTFKNVISFNTSSLVRTASTGKIRFIVIIDVTTSGALFAIYFTFYSIDSLLNLF